MFLRAPASFPLEEDVDWTETKRASVSFFLRVSQPHEYMQSPLDSAVGTRLSKFEVDIKLLSIILILVLKSLDVYIK